ncbi:hypothetical protein B484DRAFT_408953 [Ochromonadaceae sp. CCMP2298]|nr:hypothetical protein B484DRAFT_408953 [Ochromonadaceae sp. CCMP2298]
MVRVLRYVDSGELVETDDEDGTGSQDTGREQQLCNDNESSSETDEDLMGGAGAVIPGGPLVQEGVLVQAAWSKPLSVPQKKQLFAEMQLRWRSRFPLSMVADRMVKMSAEGVDEDFLRALKEQLQG